MLQARMPLRLTFCLSFLSLLLFITDVFILSLPWLPFPGGDHPWLDWVRCCRDNKRDKEPYQFVPLVPVSLSIIPSPDPLALLKQDLN